MFEKESRDQKLHKKNKKTQWRRKAFRERRTKLRVWRKSGK